MFQAHVGGVINRWKWNKYNYLLKHPVEYTIKTKLVKSLIKLYRMHWRLKQANSKAETLAADFYGNWITITSNPYFSLFKEKLQSLFHFVFLSSTAK